jgi:hypothetical protein
VDELVVPLYSSTVTAAQAHARTRTNATLTTTGNGRGENGGYCVRRQGGEY